MAAFYEARGFPVNATALLAKYCFVTVIVRNRSNQVVWLEPAQWRLEREDGQVAFPLTPGEWSELWDTVGLPAAQRAAFQWTQLPKSRDLQPQEPVGGNISFRRFSGKFTLKMAFVTGQQRDGKPVRAVFSGLDCNSGSRSQN